MMEMMVLTQMRKPMCQTLARSSERTETEDDDDGLSQASSTASGKENVREATNRTKV